LAKAFQAKLYLCYCLEKSKTREHDFITGLQHMKGLFEESLGPFISETDSPQLEWESLIAEGEVTEALNREAIKYDIDLIVMNSRRRPLAAAILGSTAETLCRTASCPVLVTHAQEREWVNISTGQVELKRLLIAYDFSHHAQLALAYGLSLAQEYQAEVHLMHVMIGGLENTWYPPNEDAFHTIARQLQLIVSTEAANWCEVKQAVRQGQPFREILRYAQENSIDLICLGAHGSGFGEWTLFGSNTDRVLRQANCPVLVARPSAVND
jgi:nucleotide-binding universal stress UspA family protein